MNDDIQESSNSFTTGFTLGFVAGVAGYFFFGTERGTKLRKEMMKEWMEARKRMVTEGVIPESTLSFRGFLHDSLHKFVEYTDQVTGETSPLQKLLSEPTKTISKATKNKRPAAHKFRGV